MRIEEWNVTKRLLSIFFTCLIVMNTNAQTAESENRHTLTAGAGTQVISDDGLSLSSEQLVSRALAWSFSNSNSHRKKTILAGVEAGAGNSIKDALRSTEFILQYTNAFSTVKNKISRWNNYTGYLILINPQCIKSGDQYSWATVNTLSFYNSLEYSWPKSIVSFDVSVPLLGFASRPGVNTINKGSINDMLYNSFSHLSFTSLHNLKAVNISFRYQKTISDKLFFTAGLSYTYKNLSVSQRFLQQAYGLGVGLSYRPK